MLSSPLSFLVLVQYLRRLRIFFIFFLFLQGVGELNLTRISHPFSFLAFCWFICSHFSFRSCVSVFLLAAVVCVSLFLAGGLGKVQGKEDWPVAPSPC